MKKWEFVKMKIGLGIIWIKENQITSIVVGIIISVLMSMMIFSVNSVSPTIVTGHFRGRVESASLSHEKDMEIIYNTVLQDKNRTSMIYLELRNMDMCGDDYEKVEVLFQELLQSELYHYNPNYLHHLINYASNNEMENFVSRLYDGVGRDLKLVVSQCAKNSGCHTAKE